MEAIITALNNPTARPTRVAHVFPSMSWGGAEIYMLQLSEWQSQAGLDVTLWCQENSPIQQQALQKGLKTLLEPVPFRQPIWSLSRLAQIIREHDFTHLQIHWSGGVMTFAGIKYFCDVKVLYHPHMFTDYRKKDIFHLLAYRQLDAVFAAGERARASYLKNLPLSAKQIHIIPYGLNLAETKAIGQKSPDLKKWNLTEGYFYIGYFGRIDRQKGAKEFLLAALPLLQEFENLRLIVVGDPTRGEQDAIDYENEISSLIKQSPLADRVYRYPHQQDFLPLMRGLQLLVMPSYQETYSLLILYAFALGLPVLSTNAGGTPDLIGENEERGWLVPPKEVEPLQKKLRTLIQSPQLIQVKCRSCLDYVQSYHDHQVVRDSFSQVYGQV